MFNNIDTKAAHLSIPIMTMIRKLSSLLLCCIGVTICLVYPKRKNIDTNDGSDYSAVRRKLKYYKVATGKYGYDKWDNSPSTDEETEIIHRILKEQRHSEPLTICNRVAPISHKHDIEIFDKYTAKCQKLQDTIPTNKTSILLLDGINNVFGRTGNNINELLHALQYAQDHTKYHHNLENEYMIVGIVKDTWGMQLLHEFTFAIDGNDRKSNKRLLEIAFCIKIIDTPDEELQKYKKVITMSTKDLFHYAPLRVKTAPGVIPEVKSQSDYVEYQSHILRTIWRRYNRGIGFDVHHRQVKDMCSVIEKEFVKHLDYTVIHSRSLEGEPGKRLLARVAHASGCDDRAALDMTPEYIKSILRPLNMLDKPILFITDHQRQGKETLKNLLADKEIGPSIRYDKSLGGGSSWVGGDIAAATLATVFIGNPASTLSGFIAKSRIALGYDNTYLFRKRKEKGNDVEWIDTQIPIKIFDRQVMGSHS